MERLIWYCFFISFDISHVLHEVLVFFNHGKERRLQKGWLWDGPFSSPSWAMEGKARGRSCGFLKGKFYRKNLSACYSWFYLLSAGHVVMEWVLFTWKRDKRQTGMSSSLGKQKPAIFFKLSWSKLWLDGDYTIIRNCFLWVQSGLSFTLFCMFYLFWAGYRRFW